VQFTKLRLAGFKSFVDPTELVFETGLTGVVGPNGCGKSNLIEALRWVMGETSAKSMRGGGMDDVIFGGSASRPARNVAEVGLALDNGERNAPAAFNHLDEIEISRRIERGEGSDYRINGREVRARDVQLLFADQATGAHSTALVSQGRIGALIAAKPAQRRLLLEEAAGITGLHSRRHEAELRLRAAEANLERLQDVIQALDGQLQALKRQAAQARRYRRLSGLIRQQEAILLHLRWTEASAAVAAAEARLDAADTVVAERTRAAAAAAAEQAEQAAALPAFRHDEAAAAAVLQRLLLARNELDAEEARIARARIENEQRAQQIRGDIERERTLWADAGAALERLAAEAATLRAAADGEGEAEQAAKAAVEAAQRDADAVDGRLTAITAQVAAGEARRADLERRIGELEERSSRLRARREEAVRERRQVAAEAAEAPALQAAEAAAAAAQRRLDAARDGAERAEAELAAAQADEERVREAARLIDTGRAELRAEQSVLASLSAGNEQGVGPPLVDAVVVEPGYEAALGAALGDDLTAPVDAPAPVRWDSLQPLAAPPALPPGIEPLAARVRAPAALARRLNQIGIVADEAQGRALRDRLAAGQRLVSRDGAMWRWDGFTVTAAAETAAAARLRQRNRLDELRGLLEAVDARGAAAAQRLAASRAASAEAAAAERAARQALHEAYAERDRTREAHAKLSQTIAAVRSRMTALDDAAARLEGDAAEARDHLTAARQALGELPDLSVARQEITALRAEAAASRSRLVERRSAHDLLVRAAADRRRRQQAIEAEAGSWRARADGAKRQLTTLAERLDATIAEAAALAARPAEIARQRDIVQVEVEAAETARRATADRLAEAETALAEADRRLRQAEGELAVAREERVRREAAVAQAQQARQTVAERIAERLDCAPEAALDQAGLAADEVLPEAAAVSARLDRLLREREGMGPVNLRAEQEAEELADRLASMQSEREDLIAAIGRLRQGIAALNREGRERLLASFATVNKHFEGLFVRLFGGGRAHLQLTEAEDPLEAGLEIMASPPGKRLQTLSLLSGGEQALTAIALTFAVFLTNPAPICALDEVDAPLDDANVDRFCALLADIAEATATRFLLVTHHRMTMARMDRLFGVTMAERGVSQLVSVDLHQAERLRATA
jgi:chromosome segregation protein